MSLRKLQPVLIFQQTEITASTWKQAKLNYKLFSFSFILSFSFFFVGGGAHVLQK